MASGSKFIMTETLYSFFLGHAVRMLKLLDLGRLQVASCLEIGLARAITHTFSVLSCCYFYRVTHCKARYCISRRPNVCPSALCPSVSQSVRQSVSKSSNVLKETGKTLLSSSQGDIVDRSLLPVLPKLQQFKLSGLVSVSDQ